MRITLVITLVCAALWLAGNAVLAGVVAPGVFAHAPPHASHFSKNVAGAVFGDLLGAWVSIVDASLLPLLTAMLAMLALRCWRRRRLHATAALAALVALAGIHLASRATVIEARALRPPALESEEAAYTEERHERFNVLHHRSVDLFGIETVLLLAVAAGAGIAVARRSDGLSPSASAPTI